MESKPNDVTPSGEVTDAIEQLYLSMFATTGPVRNRILVLAQVYSFISKNNGITLNKLQWKLKNDFSFKDEDVEVAVNALSNKNMFNAVSKFHVNSKNKTTNKPVVHLRTKKKGELVLVEAWLSKTLQTYTEFKVLLNS